MPTNCRFNLTIKLLFIPFIFFLQLQLLGQRETGGSFPYSIKQALISPRIFGEGVFSTREYELTTAFAADGKTAYFTVSTPSYGKKHTILFSKFQNGRWKTPEVATFSGFWSDADPFVSPDGNRLYFISNRPIEGFLPKNDFDIYFVEKKENGWSEPKNIGKPINSDRSELYVTVTKDKTVHFVSSRPDTRGQGDIYRSKLINGQYAEPENLGEMINTPSHDQRPLSRRTKAI